MDFSIFDDKVSFTMNVFLVIGNVINFVYNIPQVVKTYKTKSTRDFSPTFLFMRVIGNCIWLAYSIELKAFLFILSNIVSVISSIFISYYKVIELYDNRIKEDAYKHLELELEKDENLTLG
jgi:MtN3 and saliva related transmembrane protein